jgi:hypothetical protein
LTDLVKVLPGSTLYASVSPWDITTTTYDSIFFTITQDTVPRGMFFKPDGTKMFIVSGLFKDNLYEYTTVFGGMF